MRALLIGAPGDFNVVRDTMYKYSSKAEEKFLTNPTLSYMAIIFAHSEPGKDYIHKKLLKGVSSEEMSKELDN